MLSSENDLFFIKLLKKNNLNLSLFVFISFVNFNRYFYISEKSTATRTWEKNVYSCSKVGICKFCAFLKCYIDFQLASTFFWVEPVIDLVTAAC